MGMHSKCLVTVVGQYDTITLSSFKYNGDNNVVFLGVCEELGKVFLRIAVGTGTNC